MASRGATVPGTSGADYLHREQVAAHYQLSALYKSRLRWCVFWHAVLALSMLCKLAPDLLDRLDLFILEIEQLQVPQPLWWEYVWLWSLGASLWVLPALRRNRASSLRRAAAALLALGVLPALYAAAHYAPDVFSPDDDVLTWQGYRVGAAWWWWVCVALQLHAFQLYFSHRLVAAWRARQHQ